MNSLSVVDEALNFIDGEVSGNHLSVSPETREQIRAILNMWLDREPLSIYLDRRSQFPESVHNAAWEVEVSAFFEALKDYENEYEKYFPEWDEIALDVQEKVDPLHVANIIGVNFVFDKYQLLGLLDSERLRGVYDVFMRAVQNSNYSELSIESSDEYEDFGRLLWASNRPLVDFLFPNLDNVSAWLKDPTVEVHLRVEVLRGVLMQPTINSANDDVVSLLNTLPYEVVEEVIYSANDTLMEDYHPSIYRELAFRADTENDKDFARECAQLFLQSNKYRQVISADVDSMSPQDHNAMSWLIAAGYIEGNFWEHVMGAIADEE